MSLIGYYKVKFEQLIQNYKLHLAYQSAGCKYNEILFPLRAVAFSFSISYNELSHS